MSKAMKLAMGFFFYLLPSAALGTTWDEPWHERVVKEAESFVKAEVLKNEAGRQVVLKMLKQLAGATMPPEFTIDHFWLLRVQSSTPGEGPAFSLKPGTQYYVFVKKTSSGNPWALPTPTSGHAEIRGDSVFATYRHSYHMAMVTQSLYEPTMTAVFRFLHAQPYDTQSIAQLFKQQLTAPPGNLNNDMNSEESKRFFSQHVALECFYYFGKEKDYDLLEPFLSSNGVHVQISAVRALSGITTDKAKRRLMEFIEGTGFAFAKVMGIWGLKRLDAKEYLPKLNSYAAKAAEEEAGFGGNIMDPRVGTRFPESVKAAIKELSEEWQRAEPGTKNEKN